MSDSVSESYHMAWEQYMNGEFEKMWREASIAFWRLSDQGEEKNDKTLRIVGVLAEMRTGHLSKISQERYLWASSFDKGPTAKMMKVIR